MSKRTLWIVIALAISLVAYYAATFGFGHTLGATMRFRIILAMLFAQSVGLIVLGSSVSTLLAELRPYQRAASQLALLKGMWKSLDIANETNGLSPEARDAIYKAADEVFGEYAAIMRNGQHGA